MRGPARGCLLFVVALVALVLLPGTAAGHEERHSTFPPGRGATPVHRAPAEAASVLVVCKPDSAARISGITDPAVKAFNQELLAQCRFEHLQAAVDAVQVQRTNIYVLPGAYREEPSVSASCNDDYDGGIVEYELIVSCGEVLNLVTIAGDDPEDPDTTCDNQLCNLQIEGTGTEPTDVVFTGGFGPDGDWRKHNVLKADRADGIYLRNMAFELARENAVYVHETDGYAIDRVVARYNDLYGILTFTSDHGLIKDCETHHNGDSGVYPGSAADVNATNASPPPLKRWSVEIVGCDTHHNALGFSGTAGNSVWFHDNRVHHNGAGYVTDSFVGGHPGMPQDHAWIQNNRIYSNNENYYVNVQGDDPPCRKARPVDVGYENGVVCPAFPVPVGTGVLIAGGNLNLVGENEIYDNWRSGAMLFWVPGAIRGDMALEQQLDTSNGNRYLGNRLGFHPSGVVQPNGVDFWWDDQGIGNCWQDNTSATGAVTSNATIPLLPTCDLGSLLPVGNPVKSATLLPCSQYSRDSNPEPPACDWLQVPTVPAGRQAAPGEGESEGGAVLGGGQARTEGPTGGEVAGGRGGLPATGLLPPALLPLSAAAVALVVTRVRRTRL